MQKTKSFETLKTALICIIVAILSNTNTLAQPGGTWVAIGEKVTFKSNILDENRTILVYLPPSYNKTNLSYPVMYILDGGFHFHHVSGIVGFMSGAGIMPEMIVIGITNVDRNRDFSPTHTEQIPTSGGAEKFLSFLSEELIPFVDRNYRTLPYEILVGHSFGGTFATYTLLNRPETFNAYIAISPYLQYDDADLVKKAKSNLRSAYKEQKHFYMTVGNEPAYFEPLESFSKLVKQISPESIDFTYIQMKEENHGSVPHLSIYYGLESIYSDWQIPADKFQEGLETIDNHYKFITEKYGYKISTPENTINLLGYNYLNNNEFNKAIKIFKENVKRFPKSANVYDSLGEAYEKSDQTGKAEKNYEKAVQLAEKKGHQNLIIYQQNLKRAQKSVEVQE